MSFEGEGNFTAQLSDELSKARESLRNIDDNLRNLPAGRTSFIEFQQRSWNGVRRGGRFQAQPRQFQALTVEASFEDTRTAAVKRRFTAIDRDDDFLRPQKFPRNIHGGNFRPRHGAGSERGEVITGEIRRRPTMPSAVMPAQKEVKSREEAIVELKEGERKEMKQRNRRMFGVLVGTLQRFKSDEDEKFKDQELKQKEFDRKLELAKEEEERKLEQRRYELLHKRKQQQIEIRRLNRKMILIEMASEWETHMRKLQNFIQTQTKPPIFYLPAKHTMRSVINLQKSAKRIEELIDQHKERLRGDLEDLVQSKASNENKPFAQNPSNARGREVDDSSDDEGSESETEEQAAAAESQQQPAIPSDECAEPTDTAALAVLSEADHAEASNSRQVDNEAALPDGSNIQDATTS